MIGTLQKEIRKVLVNEWDPVGVGGIPEAQDEYDSYVPEIYRMLISRKEKHEIFEYLWWLETEHMGLVGDRQRTEFFVERLWSLILETSTTRSRVGVENRTLTFELGADSDEIEVHCDLSGLTELIQVLERLKKTKEHEHLMTPAWGGKELSEVTQGEKTKLMNKVTFHLRDEDER